MPEVITAQMSPEQQVRILEQYLSSLEVRQRPQGPHREFDRLIRLCYVTHETELALAIWALSGLRIANHHREAAGLLLSQLAELHAAGVIQEILEENRLRVHSDEGGDGA